MVGSRGFEFNVFFFLGGGVWGFVGFRGLGVNIQGSEV